MKRTFLVFAEEPAQYAYLEWLRHAYDHSLLTAGEFSGELELEKALALVAKARNKEKAKGTHFDEVWCMASFEDAASLAAASELARRKKIRLAGTVGGFSTWFRLHWESDDVVPSPIIGELSMEGLESILAPRTETAIRRSVEEPGMSTVHELVAALRSSSKGFTG